MDAVSNPYAPGAGTPPLELAGRDELLESARVSLERVKRGLPARSLLMVGLRGVGKTVLLDAFRDAAEAAGIHTMRIEAAEGRSLPAMLAPQLRQALLRLSRQDRARELAQRGLRALAGFAKALKPSCADLEVGIDLDPEPGLADSGDLQADLAALLEAAAAAAHASGGALALFVDALHHVPAAELATLVAALHQCAERRCAVPLFGAGLPVLRERVRQQPSYAERLFEFPEIGALPPAAAAQAITKPALAQGVKYEAAAIVHIVKETQGYPYFLQEWGKHAWDTAQGTPIRLDDVRTASASALAAMDENFFRVRFDRLTPSEKRYLRAMAELGPGPHRSGDIAEQLDRKVTALGPTRNQLISKGMVWSPNHGDTAFTVPLFDGFMRRIMPGDDWREN